MKNRNLPLKGIRVLDLTHVLSGPFCTMTLGDLGAEVLKVEKPDRGDTTRGTPPFINGVSHYFLAINRNKKSLGIDIKTDEGKQLLEKLIKVSDVMVNNFRPRVLNSLGFSYERIHEINPKLINCTISGFGNTGPYANIPTFDVITQAMSGIMSVTGYPDQDPARCGISIGDLVAGTYAVESILAALLNRGKTGQGDDIDVSMFDCLFNYLTYYITLYQATGKVPGRHGSGHPSMVPARCFVASNGYIIIASFSQAHWTRFCKAMGRDNWLSDPRFASVRERQKHRDVLEKIIGDVIKTNTVEYWSNLFQQYDMPYGPVWDISQAMKSDLVKSRGMLTSMNHPQAGMVEVACHPVKHQSFQTEVNCIPPELGQDTAVILRELAGLGEDEYKRLQNNKVVS